MKRDLSRLQKINFAQLVKRVRNKRGQTIEQFAKSYGRNKSTISFWESGDRTPPTLILFDLLQDDGQIVFYEKDCPTCNGTGIITSTN